MKQQKNSKLTSLFNRKNRKVTLNKIASFYMSVKLLNFGRKKSHSDIFKMLANKNKDTISSLWNQQYFTYPESASRGKDS